MRASIHYYESNIKQRWFFLSQFDKIKENDIPVLERLADLPPQIRDTPLQKMLINNHTDANKCKIKRYPYLEDIFDFGKTFEQVTKNLGFHLTCKTNDLQNIIYSSMADDTIATIKNLYLYVPILIPYVETQVMFNEATQKIIRYLMMNILQEDEQCQIRLFK